MKKIYIKEVKVLPIILVQAYDSEGPDGHLTNNSLVELISDNPEKAIERAKELFPDRKFFRISQYIEKEIIK